MNELPPVRKARRAVGVAIALAASACIGPTLIVQHYSGPPKPPETVAVLRVNGSDNVLLTQLDNEELGIPIASDSRLHIELLPGPHTVSAMSTRVATDPLPPANFDAEAGHVYRVVFVTTPQQNTEARVYEVERGPDRPIRDVTKTPRMKQLDPPPPAPPTPEPAPAPAE
jgi:hypothetical protein